MIAFRQAAPDVLAHSTGDCSDGDGGSDDVLSLAAVGIVSTRHHLIGVAHIAIAKRTEDVGHELLAANYVGCFNVCHYRKFASTL